MRLIRPLIATVLMFSMVFIITAPLSVSADTGASTQACEAIKAVNPNGQCDSQGTTQSTLSKILRVVLQLLTFVAGVIAVVMFIIGGLKYITSQGDAASAASARNTLLYAIIGIIVVAFAQIIVKFVLVKAK